MAERPLGFARRMMAQQLMTDALGNEFSDSPFFAGKVRPSVRDIERPTTAADMYPTAATGSLFLPGAGVADVLGQAPDPARPGQTLPSFGQNIAEGKFFDAGLQTAGAAGDVLLAMSPVLPPAAAVGTALKAPRAAKVGRAVDAAKNVDEARAAFEASPNDPVLRKQYLDLRRARDAELSQTPATEQLKLDTSYRMQHQPRGPQDGGGRLDDITAGGELFPEDVYSADGLRFYGNPNNSYDRQSYAAILAARGNPEAEITIYRGVPKDVDQINAGDWVTLSPDYAAMHAADGYGPNGDEAGKVISMKVKVKDVFSDGNDLNEFGYFPEDLAELGVKKIVPPKSDEPGIIAFHGSGADFDEFRLEMVGTGEGAQAYGYGLYFTDSEDIAKFYRNSVAVQIKINNEKFVPRNHSITEIVQQNLNDKQKIKQELVRYIEQTEGNPYSNVQDAKDIINAIDNDRIDLDDAGKTYKVGLAPKPDELLDYDLPLSQQPKMLKLIDDVHGDSEIIIQQAGLDPATATGGDFVQALGGMGTEQKSRAASEFLAKAGIPGLKYRAAGSRGAATTDEAAERNYVIFDDKAVKILEKYGIVGPVGVTAVAGTQRGDNDNEGSIFADAGGI